METLIDWPERAACKQADPDLFFATGRFSGNVGRTNCEKTEAARTFCERCPVIDACIEHALAYENYGVWGNTTEEERREMRRGLGMTVQPISLAALA